MRPSLRSRFIRVMVALVLLAPAVPVETAAAAVDCKDVHVVWARGANLDPGAFDFTTFVNLDLLPRIGAPVTTSVYQLGVSPFNGKKYLPVNEIGLILELFSTVLSPYWDSVQTGKDEFSAYLTDRAAQCPNEVYILGGYSEGANVLGAGLFDLPQSVRDRIAFVALFGDPTLDTGNWVLPISPPIGPFVQACNGGKRLWIRGSIECMAAGGIFGGRSSYVPSDIQQRVGSWCRNHDTACTGSVVDLCTAICSGGEHYKYFDENSDSAFAAREAAVRLQTFVAAHSSSFDVSYDQFVSGQTGADLAIVFDTTGSMSSAIADAKTQATALAQKWTSLFANGRVGLVEFKDQGDPFVSRVDLALTNDASAFQTAVNGLSASGGGDTPEAQLSGIMTALDGMSWATGATKAVVVITDATGKDPEPITNFTRPSVDQHALQIDPVAIYGVNVSTIQSVADWMTPMATATAGDVVTLAPGQSLSDALSVLFDSVHSNPVAKLDSPLIAQTGTAVNFIAADSFDASATITSYKWDFDGNGTVDRTTATPTTSFTYSGEFHGTASVEVVANDGRSALATALVTVDSVGLGNLQPIAPTSVTASVTGPNQATVAWTPVANDRADGYKVVLSNGAVVRFAMAADPHSAVIDGLDLSQPIRLYVEASNAYGESAAAASPSVGGGAIWGSVVRVNDDSTTTAQVAPDVAIGPSGAAIAAWQDYRASPPNNLYSQIDIYSSRWDPTTQTWGSNVRVNNVTTGEQYKPSITVGPNNDAYAAWVDWRNGRADIYFSKRSAATGVWSANVRVNSATSFQSQDQPTIAVSPSGDAIALWYRAANNKLNIWSARLPAGSTTWGPEIRVTTNQTTQKQGPKVTFGSGGTAYAVWMDPAVNNADIWYATLPPGSSTWSTNTKISDDPGAAFQGPADIGVDGAGNVLVSWTDRRATPYQLRVRRLPAGGSWTPSTIVAADGGNSSSIAVRTDGRAYVAWHDGDFNTLYPKLWGARYDQATGLWSTPERIDTNGSDHGAATPAIAIDPNRIIVTWKNALSIPSGNNDDDIFSRMRAP
jgi:Mg-chelatase subunit ChlD